MKINKKEKLGYFIINREYRSKIPSIYTETQLVISKVSYLFGFLSFIQIKRNTVTVGYDPPKPNWEGVNRYRIIINSIIKDVDSARTDLRNNENFIEYGNL